MAETTVKYDFDGYDDVTTAISELLNQYPGLTNGEKLKFSELSDSSGKAWFPVTGAVVENEYKDVIGTVFRWCLYPFIIVYRASGLSEARKAAVKSWLDNYGRWLEKQPVTINGETYRLTEYPTLTQDRTIREISRTSPAHLDGMEENQAENWVISVQLKYQSSTQN